MSEKLVRLTRRSDIAVWQESAEGVRHTIEALVSGGYIEPLVGECQSEHGCLVVMNTRGGGSRFWSLSDDSAYDTICKFMEGSETVMRTVIAPSPSFA